MPWSTLLSRLSRKRKTAWTWPLALLIFAVCLGVRLLLAPWLEQMKFLTFYPGIAATALICGWRQGFLVLALSTVSAWYLFFEPFNSFLVKDGTAVAALIGFFLVSAFILILVAALRELIHRLEKAKRLQEELFQELQHRVANNLQLAAVMLRNARRNVEDPKAAEAIDQAEERINGMARLHRRLHDGTAFAEDLPHVIRDVLAESFRDLSVDVDVGVDMEAGEALSLDQITALVLLVNEAAINAAKHVFHKGLGRRFAVSLSRDESGRLSLKIADDGPGIDATAPQSSPTLGMNIMRAFARQLGGTLQVADARGCELRVEFGAA